MKERERSSSRHSSSRSQSADLSPRGKTQKNKEKLRPVDPNPGDRSTKQTDGNHDPRGMTRRGQSKDDRDSPHSRSPSSTPSGERAVGQGQKHHKRTFTHSGRQERTGSRSKSRTSSPDVRSLDKSKAQDHDVLVIHAELDDTTLSLLGDVPTAPKQAGESLHRDIVTRWKQILENGLKSDVRDGLIKAYPTPKNCTTISAPKLNPEIAATMSQTSLKKDGYQIIAQSQLGAALSAVGNGLTLLLNDEKAENKTQLVGMLGDAGRLLAGLHHSNSITRRAFITPSLGLSVKPIADKSPIDNFLFGENLAETLKAARALERTGKELRAEDTQSKRRPTKKHGESQIRKDNLNWHRPYGPSFKPKDRRYGPSRQGQNSQRFQPKNRQYNQSRRQP